MAEAPPLTGLKVVELAGLAPGPFCGLLLSSYGASVLRIDRAHTPHAPPASDMLTTDKASIALDLKTAGSLAVLKAVLSTADVLIDPFRPGVLEKLGLDPATVLQQLNPRLIVARLTGFRRDGKYRDMAGHDINYLAASGVLGLLGAKRTPPLPPGNLLADFAGGGAVAFTGVLLALISRGVTGRGQVVEANMVDGAGYLATFARLATKTPTWGAERGTNVLDGGCPYYGCYECKDAGKYMSVGSLEPQFFAELLKGLQLKIGDCLAPGVKDRADKSGWAHMKGVFERKFKQKTRKEWEAVFDGTDACVVPVLEFGEMETEGYEQRPMVNLVASPARKVSEPWVGKVLGAGEGGEKRLREWMGWESGKHFEADRGGKGYLVKIDKSRI